MKRNSGEVLTAILIGLALGGIMSAVRYNQWAQNAANLRGVEIGVGDYVAERPLEAIGYPVLGAAGWGVGELLGGDDDRPDQPRDVYVSSGRDSTVVISGGAGEANNTQSQPTTTTTTTTPAESIE